jgi:Na+/H+-dicarboxylate symporter/ABC-type amino acid transport substrate-binding protein
MSQQSAQPEKPKKKLGLSARCFLGMGIGVVVGILIGPYAALFDTPSAIFLQLLKMTVIPYLVVSLVIGLGSLTPSLVARVGKASLLALFWIWLLSIAVIYSLGVTFPHDGSPRFHTSSSTVSSDKEPKMVELFIPDNPFQALADGTVPAVVLFLLLVSLALLEHPSKKVVLDLLEPVQHALVWVTNQINKLLPWGVFFLTAQVAGTMTASELAKLGLYVALYALGTVVLCFWLFPMAVSITTPYSFRTLLRDYGGPVALALGTGSAFVALPSMMEGMRNLIREAEGSDGQSEADAVIPVAYNFPHAGTMFNFLFLLFTASAYGVDVAPVTQLKVIATGIPALFSGGVFAMGFLLDQSGLPADALGLYMNVQSITLRFKASLAVVSLFSMSLWIHSSLRGQFRFPVAKMALLVGGTCAVLIAGGLVARPMLSHEGQAQAQVSSWTLETTNVEVLDGVPEAAPATDAVTRLHAGGPIYAGYFPDHVPYSYTNDQGKLVGYSVAMADRFGRDLQVQVKLVPIKFGQIEELLNQQKIDTVFAPVSVSGALLRTLEFTQIYSEELPYLVVRDSDRERIGRLLAKRDLSGLTIAVFRGTVRPDASLLSGAKIVEIDHKNEFLKGTADGLLADEVSALGFQLEEPKVHGLQMDTTPVVQIAMPLSPGNPLRHVLDTWITLRRNDKSFEALVNSWINGQEAQAKDERQPLLRF